MRIHPVLMGVALTCGATLVLAQTSGSVIVNGQPVPESVLGQLAQQYRVQIPAGRYWYDPACGAWGLEGGPAAGITMAGISLGGPLRVDASGGSARGFVTGVFINGREIHPIDYQALCQLVPVGPGRYWVDAWGNAGYEGMPAAINLWQLAQSRGGGGRGYHHAGPGGYTGSDGNTFYFFDPETGSSVMSN